MEEAADRRVAGRMEGRKGETEAWNGVAGACKRGLGAWERWRGWRL